MTPLSAETTRLSAPSRLWIVVAMLLVLAAAYLLLTR
jgi:hypothetical protein